MKKNFSNRMFRNGTIILSTAMSLIFGAVQTFAQCSTPAAITGTTVLCPPTYTTTLSDATPGGTWSAGDAVLTVDASTGVVTGTSGGVQTVTYTVPGGCFTTTSVTNSAITGPSTLCYAAPGSTITLSDAMGGGTWSSSNTNLAVSSIGDVQAGSGFTGSLASATISYSLPGVCGGAFATKAVTIDPIPSVSSFTSNGTTFCELDNIYFITTITGGVAPYNYNWQWNDGSWHTFFNHSGATGLTDTGAQLGGVTMAEAGNYFTNVTDALGCTTLAYSPINITVNPRPTVETLTTDPGCTPFTGCRSPGRDLYLSSTQSGVTYSYGIAGALTFQGSFSGSGSTEHFTTDGVAVGDYIAVGVYTVTGCGSLMSPPITICGGCGKQGNNMSSTPTAEPLTLSPNPNNGNFILSGSADFMLTAKTVRTEIMDITGRMVLSQDVPVANGGISQTMELPGDIAGGLYFVKVSTDRGSQVLRLSLSR